MRYRNAMLRRIFLLVLLAGFATAMSGCGKEPPKTLHSKSNAPSGRMQKPQGAP
jgi:hypothetical protein